MNSVGLVGARLVGEQPLPGRGLYSQLVATQLSGAAGSHGPA